jgi:hypothetical protein
MKTKLVSVKNLVEQSCKNTPKLKCKLIGVVDAEGNRLKLPEQVEVIVECGSK